LDVVCGEEESVERRSLWRGEGRERDASETEQEKAREKNRCAH
jgi:hypothetical protein